MFKKFCAYLHLIPPIKSSAVVNLHFVFVLLLCHQFKPQKSFVCGRHLLFFDGVQGTHNRKNLRDLILNKITGSDKTAQIAELRQVRFHLQWQAAATAARLLRRRSR